MKYLCFSSGLFPFPLNKFPGCHMHIHQSEVPEQLFSMVVEKLWVLKFSLHVEFLACSEIIYNLILCGVLRLFHFDKVPLVGMRGKVTKLGFQESCL